MKISDTPIFVPKATEKIDADNDDKVIDRATGIAAFKVTYLITIL